MLPAPFINARVQHWKLEPQAKPWVLDVNDLEYIDAVIQRWVQKGPIMHGTYVDIKLFLEPAEPILYYDIYLRRHENT
ncbi:hypothetical protein TRAPUB_10434 [Trametes pubescens]|uniref:Uncharacterized protein n=1 Tax=Trametes pubescens TaxID=154538 RepID=A0A1M2VZJ8_TRAPU|nr:hypothetical protein TRAPUB_10434 [Trametes pubescens]